MPTSGFSSAERELFEEQASKLYQDTVLVGRVAQDDPRLAEDAAERPAFDLLVTLGLLVPDTTGESFVPVDPSTVQAQVIVPMGQRAATLLDESSRWSDAFVELGQTYRRATSAKTPVTEIRGVDNVNRFLDAAFEDAQDELLCAQPTRGRAQRSLENAEGRDHRAVRRGVLMRTLYQHSARRSAAIRDYVQQMAPYGAQVRTLEEFFNRMFVVDRTVAVVPSQQAAVWIAIHEPALVEYLADMFERHWERARPFDDQVSTRRVVAEDVRKLTVRMLVEGHSDPASAKRVGVSTRTYAGYIAALKEEYGVQTRFQLGYAMGQQSPDGDDEPGYDEES